MLIALHIFSFFLCSWYVLKCNRFELEYLLVYLSTREEYSSYVLAWYVHGAKESCLENDLYGELMNLYQVTIGILIRV
jgi:hypothetical protein